MSPGEYVAVAYGVVLVFVLVYVAILAAKLSRLQRETAELLELVPRSAGTETEAPTESAPTV